VQRELTADGESDAGTAFLGRSHRAEQPLANMRRKSCAFVADAENDLAIVGLGGEFDALAAWCGLDRVIQQILQDQERQVRFAVRKTARQGAGDRQADFALGGRCGVPTRKQLEDLADADLVRRESLVFAKNPHGFINHPFHAPRGVRRI